MIEPETTYAKGELGAVMSFIIERFQLDSQLVAAEVLAQFRQLRDKSTCGNCKASMQMYVYHLDCLAAVLVYEMGSIIKTRVRGGMPFTEANAVHVQSQETISYAVKSRTTWCSKLGLIAMVLNPDGTHNTKRGWLVTKRGFALLRGERVPSSVEVFRNEIQTRHETETITIGDAFMSHKLTLERQEREGKKVKNDYRPQINSYNLAEWVEFGTLHDGALL